MEFGKKLRITQDEYDNNPIALEAAYMQGVHMIIEEMPTEVIKKIFKMKVINTKESGLTLKTMNPSYPIHLKRIFEELKNKNEVEISISLKLE